MPKPVPESFPPRVCLALERMEACRENEKAREADLVKHRKQVKQDFLNLGPGETNAHKTTALDLVKTLLHIDYCRVRQSTLADQIGETIRGAHQPGLFTEDADIEEIVSREPDDDELFSTLRKSKPDPEQQEFGDDSTPVGEPSKTIDDYLPGRFKDQSGKEENYYDMDAIRAHAAGLGQDIDIVPRVSPSYGATFEFKEGETSRGTLTYCGKPKGRRKAG